jgi:uncharacterized protein YjiS (DUF1127 family)
MPPQQTNFASETGRDAPGLSLDLAMPLVKDARGHASAEVRPDPSIAAPRDASSEKEAAGPPVASTLSVLSVLLGYWRELRKRRQAESLHNLSDRELADIGLTPGDVDHLVARRAIERLRDGTTHLWLSRGV